MKAENIIKNDLKTLIEGLKDSFDEDDLEYMEINEIKLCQEDSTWGHYTQEVISLMSRIRLLVNILEISENDFEKIFDDIKQRGRF